MSTATTSTAEAPSRRTKRQRRRRRALVVLAVVAVVCVGLTRLDTQVRTPVGARGVGRGAFPLVEVAGLGSNGAGFARLTAAMQARGVTVLDFDAGTPGVQPLVYRQRSGRPESGQRIAALAVDVVQPEIRQALTQAGLDPMTQQVDVVAHSMGGLLVRYLIEHPVAGWAQQVDDLVMVATPNHGSDVIAWETGINGNPTGGLGQDMKPGSGFLDALGYREPADEVYTTIGGDPWLFRWLRYGSHGFDDQVPTESAFLKGAALDSFDHFHGRLLRSDEVVSLIERTLVAHSQR